MHKREKGFTLAEVLVTLAIIGVVAALTIPTLIQNTSSSKFQTGVKKTVSVLGEALQTKTAQDSISVNNAITSGHTHAIADATGTGDIDLANYFKSYLSVVHDGTQDATPTGTLTLADGTKLQFGASAGVDTTDPANCVNSHTETSAGVGYAASTPDSYCDLYEDDGTTANATNTTAHSAGLLANTPAAYCPAIAAGGALTDGTNCYVLVDVNGDKNPNRASTISVTNDIFVLGISANGVLPVDATGFPLPFGAGKFASGDTAQPDPGTASVIAVSGT